MRLDLIVTFQHHHAAAQHFSVSIPENLFTTAFSVAPLGGGAGAETVIKNQRAADTTLAANLFALSQPSSFSSGFLWYQLARWYQLLLGF